MRKILRVIQRQVPRGVVLKQEFMKDFLKINTPLLIAMVVMLSPTISHAASASGTDKFAEVYNFIHGAATGAFGKSIAIVGLMSGLIYGAAAGKALPALGGVVLAIFTFLGPTFIDSLFTSATI